MIIGAHSIIYSADAEADRVFLRDVLKLTHVDVGGGWLIFGLPPAEVAVHPAGENQGHEFYLITNDVAGFIAEMQKQGVQSAPVTSQRWGSLTHITLPGGGKLGVYEPRHARPKPMRASPAVKRTKATKRKTKNPKAKKASGKPTAARTTRRRRG